MAEDKPRVQQVCLVDSLSLPLPLFALTAPIFLSLPFYLGTMTLEERAEIIANVTLL